MSSNPQHQQQQQAYQGLSPQDLAQFESLGAGTGSANDQNGLSSSSSYQQNMGLSEEAAPNPAAARNPYNPFLSAQQDQSTPQQSYQSQPSHNPFVAANAEPQAQMQESTPYASQTAMPEPAMPAMPAQSFPAEGYQAPPGPQTATSVPQQAYAPPSGPPPELAAAAVPSVAAAPQHQRQDDREETAWSTKDIIFQGRECKIVMQNANGPCSLLSIANILLLRGDVSLQPPDRPLVNYDYLSSLIAEYLLMRPAPSADGALEKSLSLLPQTRHGLNLNPSFLDNTSFLSSDGARHLELFDLLGIKLYHGFLPDDSSPETHELLSRAGSYDAAMDQVVQGDELAVRFFAEALGESGQRMGVQELKRRGGFPLVESTPWGTALQRQTLREALEISNFLESNASQLTYPGLFALSALPEGTLGALFRFNHVGVFYRPTTSETAANDAATEGATQSAPPSLLTLLTDEAFVDEELAVWESLADIDGMDSGEIFDGRLRRRRIDQAGSRAAAAGLGAFGDGGDMAGVPNEDADFALALQLHSQERDRAERRGQRNRTSRLGNGPGSSRDPTSASGGFTSNADPSSQRKSGFKGALGLGRKREAGGSRGGPASPSGEGGPSNYGGAGSPSANERAQYGSPAPMQADAATQGMEGAAADLGTTGRRDKKKDCIIM